MIMSEVIELTAEERQDVGKGASRRLRREEKVPAIVYGGGKAPIQLTLESKGVRKALEKETFYSQVLTLKIGANKSESTILKAIQRHPAKGNAMHLDFLRIDATHELTTTIPLHFKNEDICLGVKAGGAITHNMIEVEVRCLAKDLPQFIEVDMANLEKGSSVHLTNLNVPESVKLMALAQGKDHDQTVALVHAVKVTDDEELPTSDSEDTNTDTDN